MNKAAKWKTHLDAEFSTCSFPSLVQGPARGCSWKTGRQAGRYQRVRQEVCAWHTKQRGPGFPGKKSESILSSLCRKLKAELAASLHPLETCEVTRVPGIAGGGVLPIQSSLGGGTEGRRCRGSTPGSWGFEKPPWVSFPTHLYFPCLVLLYFLGNENVLQLDCGDGDSHTTEYIYWKPSKFKKQTRN